MPLGIVEKERRGRDDLWFIQETPDGPRRELQSSELRRSGWGALELADLLPDLDVEFTVERGQIRDVHRYAAVPEAVRCQLDRSGCDHPGLVLDKYVYRSYDQSFVRGALQKVIDTPAGLDREFPNLLGRWRSTLATLHADSFRCTSSGPLTLHLARASALENAGICLHPLYGFVYLPGSGLKGMARAYAETVWLSGQTDKGDSWHKIEDVFGWAPNPDRRKQIKDKDHPAAPRRREDGDPQSPEITSSCGGIVFHDAWPESWPHLLLDIVNNHHRDYYAPPDKKKEYPPGDWEEPSMVSFLAIGAKNTFIFALAPRRSDVGGDLLRLAREWLVGALTHEGAGAKTAAGYGRFRIEADSPVAKETEDQVKQTWRNALGANARAEYPATLELVTPAFLAGANQQLQDDCDLRPATLRGVLRWWWRTMHVGYIDVTTLRRMEAAVWGDTDAGGPVRLTVVPSAETTPVLYDPRDRNQRFRLDPAFQRTHQLQEPPDGGTTQGLFYASYGMNDGGRQRHYRPPAARWAVCLSVQASRYEEKDAQGKCTYSRPLSPQMLLEQARAALWLLCHLGGVGSKARKGFGSFTDLPGMTFADCTKAAVAFRQTCERDGPFRQNAARSPSLSQMLSPPSDPQPWLEVATPWTDPWFALDQVGYSAQAFAQRYAHQREKAALGLPRQIHGPRPNPMQHQDPSKHRRPERLSGPQGDRHAAPVIYHLARGADGGLTIRVTAFLASELPDKLLSERMLRELLAHLQSDLQQRVQEQRGGGQAPSTPAAAVSAAAVPLAGSGRRPPGTRVRVKILGPHEKGGKGAFFVQENGKPKGIVSQAKAPATLPEVGATVEVFINSDDPRSPQYRWDRPEQQSQDKPDRRRPGGSGRRPGGRR